MTTLEEKLKIVEKKRLSEKGRAERKKLKIQRRLESEEMKKSHDWVSQFVFYKGLMGMAGKQQVSHCKKCGIAWMQFKITPQYCKK